MKAGVDFNLESTLTCGQYFQWKQDQDWFVVRSRGVTGRLRQTNGELEFKDVDRAWVKHLFALDHPLDRIRAALSRDPVLRPWVQRYPGLRVMRQDPWECLLGFMLSSVSNIPRIRNQMWTLGPIPRPGKLRDLSALRAGFRARHILAASRQIDEGWLEGIRSMDDDAARRRLQTLHGVGPKIADCVLLYGYGRLNAFPVDVWIERMMKRVAGRSRSKEAYADLAARRWGRWAGYAQLYLFKAARDGR